MQQCAEDEREQFPQAAKVVTNDFYMDDCLTGEHEEPEAAQLCNELVEMLSKGGFMLSKWHSNVPSVLPSIMSMDQAMEPVELSDISDTTVLGLRWLPSSDELAFKFQPLAPDGARTETMRQVLSQIARLFDPNGYLGPAIVPAKIIMQRMYESRIKWDDRIPADIEKDWIPWQSQLQELTKIKIRRWIGISPDDCFTLHGFADASQLAYGAVVYVRVEGSNGIECILIASRSRVAPLRTVTVPRLELLAAKLLAELLCRVKAACHFKHIKSTLWTDSSIVLQWMKKDTSSLKSFVHNRVQSIRELTTDCDWRHVPTETNPADLLSRGVAPKTLQENQFWWSGPAWLQQESCYWPNSQPDLTMQIERQVRAD